MSATSSHPDATQNGAPNGGTRTTFLLRSGKIDLLRKGTNLADLDEQGWTYWSNYLSKRKSPAILAKLTEAQGLDSLLWGVSKESSAEAAKLSAHLAPKGKRALADDADIATIASAWLAEYGQPNVAAGDVDAQFALECLTWCHQLPTLAATLGGPLWCEMLAALLQVAEDAAAIDVEARPLAHQLLAGELSLALSTILPELKACESLEKVGRNSLRLGVSAWIDGDGEIAASQLDNARSLLACWTRGALLGGGKRKPTFDRESALLLRAFLRQTLAMMRADGTQMLSSSGASQDRDLFAAALKTLAGASERSLAKHLLPKKKGTSASKNGKAAKKNSTDASTHSEWAALALLRCSWEPQSPRLLVDYSGDALRTELFVDRNTLWSGECSPTIVIDRMPLQKDTAWREVCWHSDEDVDYLELEAEYFGGWKCQRQFMLDRQSRFLLVADAVIGTQSASIDYRCTWPADEQLSVVPESETTECLLAAGKNNIARVLPLGLPEWQNEAHRIGTLEATDGGLQYSLTRAGMRLYAPLCFDLDPARLKYPFTWRHLTVGNNLEKAPPDEAVGYRVQLRLDQWLIYRSLAPVASRTVLGQNYYHEFVCGRFERCGDVEPLIEVE